MNPIDCSEVFPRTKRADFIVIGNSVRIRLWGLVSTKFNFEEGEHIHIDMDVNKIANFLEKIRREQAK